ncbi:MAG: MBL fold metallo-hydrolase [Pseudomonadota bacterium]
MSGPFNLDHTPVYGAVEPLAPSLRCVTAPNGGPMTFTGTRTYILGEGRVAVVDPGPVDAVHLQAVLAALEPGEEISHILITHAHLDHTAGLPALREITKAPVVAFGSARAGQSAVMARLIAEGHDLGGGEGIDLAFAPDETLTDGAVLYGGSWTVRAIHTPGHISNHLCFDFPQADALLTGDHVMGWATTLVSPPDGDLTAFMASLDKVQPFAEGKTLYPGHGAPVQEGIALIDHIRQHRQMRERQIREALAVTPATPQELTRAIYTDVPAGLLPVAERNVFAHLIDLYVRGVADTETLAPTARFSLA